MMINLLNFPYNLEEMVQEDESLLNKNYSISDWMQFILSKNEMSRDALAKKLKISPNELTKMEEDFSIPSNDWVLKMLKILDLE